MMPNLPSSGNNRAQLFEETRQIEEKVPNEKGKLYSSAVQHDDWCQIYRGGECNCDPDITFTEFTKENRANVTRRIDEETAKFQEKVRKKMV
jgi:hypothetical protein